MRRMLLTVVFLAGLCCIAYCDEQVRLLDSVEDPSLYSPYQEAFGTVSLETGDFKEGEDCLRFEIRSPGTGYF